MNGFFGIFNPLGAGVDSRAFDQMKNDLDFLEHIEMSIYVDDYLALGYVLLKESSESKFEKQPIKSSCGKYLLVGYFRLDYRDELGDKLSLTQIELDKTSDSRLVMMAYQKWNKKCVYHLEGDWTFLIYDLEKKSIFVSKDKTGYTSLFYLGYSGSFYFSNNGSLIVRSSPGPLKYNLAQLARLLWPFSTTNHSLTIVDNLFALSNGECLQLSARSSLIKEKYFDINTLILLPELKYKFIEDAIFNHFSFLILSVKSRLSQKLNVGLFLSSGQDSLSVAGIISAELKFINKKFYTYTSIPTYKAQLNQSEIENCDESVIVNEVSQILKNSINQTTTIEKIDFLQDCLVTSSNNILNPIISKNSVWVQEIIKKAKHDRMDILFNAQLGNSSFSIDGYFSSLDLLKNMSFKALSKRINRISIKNKKSYFRVFLEQIIFPLRTKLILFVKYHYLFSSLFFIKNRTVGIKHYSEFLVRKSKKSDEYLNGYTIFKSSKHLRSIQLRRNILFSGGNWYWHSCMYKVQISDPMCDFRLIQHSMQCNESLFSNDGENRFVSSQILSKFYSEDIVIGSKKNKLQSYDFGLFLKDQRGVEKFLSDIRTMYAIDYLFDHEIVSVLYKRIINSNFPQRKHGDISFFLAFISIINFIKTNKNVKFVG